MPVKFQYLIHPLSPVAYPYPPQVKVFANLIDKQARTLPGGPVVKNPPANAGDMGLIPGLRRFHIPQDS